MAFRSRDPQPFHGAKAALLLGPRLLILQRDDLPHIGHPGLWDLPGGGREGRESPRETLARETREEVGLDLADPALAADWLWEAPFPSATRAGTVSWFFVLRLAPGAEARIALGDEGQGWRLVTPAAFLVMPDAVGFLQDRLRLALRALGETPFLA